MNRCLEQTWPSLLARVGGPAAHLRAAVTAFILVLEHSLLSSSPVNALSSSILVFFPLTLSLYSLYSESVCLPFFSFLINKRLDSAKVNKAVSRILLIRNSLGVMKCNEAAHAVG